jgi:putative endonuclease
MATLPPTNKNLKRKPAKNKGDRAESGANRWLIDQGLVALTQNYRCKSGEIDLIMLDQQQLVFVEVRFRSNSHFGSAAESVNRPKQKKLLKAAAHFLLTHKKYHQHPCRFDVIAAQPSPTEDKIDYQWIKNAFTA